MPAPPRSGPATVLVVDDEAAVRALTARMLEEHGYRVLEAQDGLEAWKLLETRREPIDLVISDVVMPRLDGLQLAESIDMLDDPPAILLMSGYGLRMVAFERPLIVKPFRSEELLAAVRGLMRATARDDPGKQDT